MKRAREEEWDGVVRVISGGQVGADRAALEAAEYVGLDTGGWAACDFQTVDGPHPELGERFGLRAVSVKGSLTSSYVLRSKRNVQDSDATVAFRTHGSVGTDKTIGYCRTGKWGRGVGTYTSAPFRPCLVISELYHARFANNASMLYLFLVKHNVKTLNICGHRAAPPDTPDYDFQIKRLLIQVLNPQPFLHTRLDGIPLSLQYDFAAYDGAWLREEDHCYKSDRDPHRYYMPSSTLQKRMFPQFEFKEKMMAQRCAGSKRSSGGKYEFCTPEEVLQMWEDNRQEASRLGTAMHNSFEDYYNGEVVNTETPEFQLLKQFMEDHPLMIPIAAEKVLLCDFLGSAGTFDIGFRDMADPDPNSLVIGDWKRSVELKFRGYAGECGWREGTKDRQNCNYQHFTINMTQYKFMSEQPKYGRRVRYMFLVGCHPKHERYEFVPIKWERNHANHVIAERLRDKLVYRDLGEPSEPESMPWNAIPEDIMLEVRSREWKRHRPRIELPSAETVLRLKKDKRQTLLRVRVFHFNQTTCKWGEKKY